MYHYGRTTLRVYLLHTAITEHNVFCIKVGKSREYHLLQDRVTGSVVLRTSFRMSSTLHPCKRRLVHVYSCRNLLFNLQKYGIVLFNCGILMRQVYRDM